MKTASRLTVAAALALGLTSLQPAAAAPATFRFELPDWTMLVGSPATYGTHGVLTVTVDNGADDLIAQTYLNNSIQTIRMAASGGSYDHAFAGTMAVASGGAALLSYFSTDAAGVPILGLPVGAASNAYQFLDGTYFLQLATIQPTSGYWPISVSDEFGGLGRFAALAPSGPDGSYIGVVVKGSVVPVPGPAPWALAGLGIAALGFAGRRARAG